MPGLNLLASLVQQATAQGTRATILTPLAWFFGLSVTGLLVSVRWHADFWIQVLLAIFAALGAVTYLSAYVFCLATKQPRLLQTEKYLIQELAIEKGYGDNSTGLLRIETPSNLLSDPLQSSPVQITAAKEQE